MSSATATKKDLANKANGSSDKKVKYRLLSGKEFVFSEDDVKKKSTLEEALSQHKLYNHQHAPSRTILPRLQGQIVERHTCKENTWKLISNPDELKNAINLLLFVKKKSVFLKNSKKIKDNYFTIVNSKTVKKFLEFK